MMSSARRIENAQSLRAFAKQTVRVRLDDDQEFIGKLRTELLSERAVSVYLDNEFGGVTLYIDRIADVKSVSLSE